MNLHRILIHQDSNQWFITILLLINNFYKNKFKHKQLKTYV